MTYKLFSVIAAALVAAFLVLPTARADSGAIVITDPNQGHKLFTDAVNAKDLERLVSMYADDAVMVAPGNKVISGKKAIRAFFVDAVKSIQNIKLETVFRINTKDTVVFRSKYTVTYKLPDGQIVTQSTSGIEVEKKQKDGTWLFVVDHHYGGADFSDFAKLNKPS